MFVRHYLSSSPPGTIRAVTEVGCGLWVRARVHSVFSSPIHRKRRMWVSKSHACVRSDPQYKAPSVRLHIDAAIEHAHTFAHTNIECVVSPDVEATVPTTMAGGIMCFALLTVVVTLTPADRYPSRCRHL